MKHEMSQKEVLNYNIKIGDKVRIAIPEKEDTSRINNFFVKKSLLSSSNDGQWSNSIYIVYDIWEQQNKDQPIGAPFVYRVKNINTENILKHTFSRAQILLVNKNDLVSRGQKDQPEESKRIERKIRK